MKFNLFNLFDFSDHLLSNLVRYVTKLDKKNLEEYKHSRKHFLFDIPINNSVGQFHDKLFENIRHEKKEKQHKSKPAYYHGFTISDIFKNSSREYIDKRQARKILFIGVFIYFLIMTAGVISFILFWKCSYKLKIAVVSGFFANLFGLLIVIFKYVFSPSDSYYVTAMEMYKLKQRYNNYNKKNKER